MHVHARMERNASSLWRRRIVRAVASAIAVVLPGLVGTGEEICRAQTCSPFWTNAGAELVVNVNPVPIVLGFSEFDPDGAGPLKREFFIVGDFAFAGIPSATNIARWDGLGWADLGVSYASGLPNNVVSQVYDALQAPDIDGTDGRSALYVVGGFSSVGGVQSRFIAKWDGSAWSGLPGLPSSLVAWAVALHDFDGPGGAAPELVVGGVFPAGPNLSHPGIYVWRGGAWVPVGGPSRCAAHGLASFDPDGDGPQPATLLATLSHKADPAPGIYRWTGADWELEAALGPLSRCSFATVDLDGPGPSASTLFAATAEIPNAIIRRREADQSWSVESAAGSALASVDRDGAGPLQPELFAFQIFEGGQSAPDRQRLWRLDSAGWNLEFDVPYLLAGSATAMAWFDEDGAGPRPLSLFVGGDMRTANSATVTGIARYGCPFNMPRCYGDANGSGVVDFNDISLVIGRWSARNQPGDINHDGVVGMNDVVGILASWGSPCVEARPAAIDTAAAWRARGIEDFNSDGQVNFDDYSWAIANAGFDARSPFGRPEHIQSIRE